jgi:hypothetical protein
MFVLFLKADYCGNCEDEKADFDALQPLDSSHLS